MKPQEDIGSLIKTKLQSTKKASDEATWDRIQHSLKEREKKKRLALYTKLGLASLLLLIGALFVLNYLTITPENTTPPQEEIYSNMDTPKTVDTEKNNVQDVPSRSTSISTNNNNDAKNLDHTIKNKGVENNAKAITEAPTSKGNTSKTNISKQSSNNTNAIDTIVNRNDVLVTQTTQKIYYYYNSKTGQEISSTDKRVIDSMVIMNQIKQDSLKINN